MPGRSARTKGHQYERDLANLFKDRYRWKEAKRGWQYSNGRKEPDVIIPYLYVEAKRQKKTYPKKALEQAMNDLKELQKIVKEDKIPVAITKEDRQDALITLRLDDFLTIFDAYVQLKESDDDCGIPS